MESEKDSNRTFTTSYFGDGNKPLNFKFEVYESSHTSILGEGELRNQDEFEIDEVCSGACDAVPDSIPIQIQWEGKEEKIVIRKK
ncbi:hypothetical protein KHA96_18390 [Bacillus sp. FJAT-49711]|uniref:hypothetical protein n=1 Tax=Bacillus sp. FJAT-49711 TaxID=2833585 RepID=UPI001BC9B602|nr:hypothetical protein [Bacillus sp. FJAT-49711]MBS4220274.1 hypothetical protein [Bacillus sp. FJAT-49711]